jgi:hypothetical protein
MTKIEKFTMAAMQGILSNPYNTGLESGLIAELAYRTALVTMELMDNRENLREALENRRMEEEGIL